MAKKSIECPVCKKPVMKHTFEKALDCVNDLKLLEKDITEESVIEAGYAIGGLKGRGQTKADRNIISLAFEDGDMVDTVEPRKVILQKTLAKHAKKEKENDKDSGGKGLFNRSSDGDSEGDSPIEESE